ncbi:MAG: hypothetical protein WCP46_01500 [Alphaproteobacteria bacterium]|jgi:tetratricopeptide (TPR) repeat protein
MAIIAAVVIVAKDCSATNVIQTAIANTRLNEFESSYHTLKEQENWQEIIIKGIRTINNDALTNEEKSLIYARLASCYFYLGNYEEARKAALEGFKLAGDDPNLLGRSLYLQSAIYRATKQQELAFKMIKKALELTNNPKMNEYVKAKIYFNAGALHQDLFNQSELASQYYKQAMKIYKEYSDDYCRTAIRYIRCLVELGKLNEAKEFFENLQVKEGSKTFVHLLQIKGKICLKEGDNEKGLLYLNQALAIAQSKGMVKDAERLNELINNFISNQSQSTDTTQKNWGS